MTVFLNGRFLDRDQARVSALDAGFQHAVGLFETMSATLDGGRATVFRLDDHLQRLRDSARELGLADPLRTAPLAEALLQTVERAGLPKARVRLTVTGGDLNLLAAAKDPQAPRGPIDPTILIAAQPPVRYPDALFEQGIAVMVADWRLNPLDPFAGHKTLWYWPRLRELQRAAAAGAGEALVLQVTNHLAGGCVSSILLVEHGRLVAPIARGEEATGPGAGSLPSPVLPGITRRTVLDLAARRGVECIRRMLSIDDLLGADEVFLTNSSWGILPVVRVEKATIAAGRPGPMTAGLRRDLAAHAAP